PRPAPAGPVASGVDLGQGATGMNPLNAAAAPLFALVGRIRNRAQHPNPEALRQAVVREIQAFEQRALHARIPAQSIQIARYALCATIDDVVMNTPWGGRSSWTTQSMVGTFHREVVGGERFFDLLARLEKEPSNNRQLLEFIYICLSLGFEGRLRVEERGSDRHLSLRENLARLIRAQRGPLETDLSPRWPGVELPHRPLSAWLPLWVIAGVTAGFLGLGWFGLSWLLSGDTERLQGQLATLHNTGIVQLDRPAPPPPPPPPPPPEVITQTVRLKKFLEPEIKEGLVTVVEDASTVTVRIAGGGMFPSASDQLKPEFLPVIQRVAEALNGEPGPVIIAGHSDSDRIRSARFPNNLALSLKRAESVMKFIARTVNDPSRLSAEGRGEREPLVPNSSSANKAQNRRIEVILVKES
ncbi:MAG TPA: type IVB secretion system protein IcmH/DotU, partial [Paracoccaceae bacterium]|nr:type IVB secretion system protein IcmH/DotU [Paracoccaceae bacterium]